MLQRKLLLVLGSLIVLLLLAAVSAIGVLHNVLEDLIAASSAAATGTEVTQMLERSAGAVGMELEMARRQPTGPMPAVAHAVETLDVQVARLGDLADGAGEVTATVERLGTLVPVLAARVVELEQRPSSAGVEAAIAAARPIIEEATALGGLVREQSGRELQQLVHKFRVGGLVIGIVSLILLNVSIVVVLRAATMVLRPVDQLVDASRRLGREEFDHRVEVKQEDEFGELAQAYNTLAGQLQANEERKLETLHQVARTLSHEVNNAISTIELQLTVMDRRKGDETFAEPLRRIHQSLARVNRTIDSLTRVRRIVLTDYLSGVKMLDLERSVQDDG